MLIQPLYALYRPATYFSKTSDLQLVLDYKMGNHVLCSLYLHMHTYTNTHVEVQ